MNTCCIWCRPLLADFADAGAARFASGGVSRRIGHGAAKVRAMEIIAELEPTARGAYCGRSDISASGAMDLNISDPHNHGRPRLVAISGRRRRGGTIDARAGI